MKKNITRFTEMRMIVVLILAMLRSTSAELRYTGNGETREFWQSQAQADLTRARSIRPNTNVAKNVIIFIGDGMGMSTITAARILKGQLQNKTGEETILSFETFPHIGLSKTYDQDAQTTDSAGAATAMYTGIKTNQGVLGVDARSIRGDCSTIEGTEIPGILKWSQEGGKAVGFVTTTRVTHATPAALYAHTPERDWEGDVDTKDISSNCKDITRQLIDDNFNISVMMGGGRRTFLAKDEIDPETRTTSKHGRLDGRNLIQDWEKMQRDLGRRFKYVWNQTGFENIDPENTDYLLGLFNPSHMEFEVDRKEDLGGEPSLAEMTEKAIKILRKSKKGYFLLVEGGRIDHGHHYAQPVRSLHDTIAFADAVQKGIDMTDESDTLIIATADHSHTFTLGGYPTRGNPIFGLTDDRRGGNKLGQDLKPFTTLGYANGPGSFVGVHASVRPDLTHTNTADKNFRSQSAVPLESETHGGEDVPIYARGPMSHLFHGVHEQNYIGHVMAFASCVGNYTDPDNCALADVRQQPQVHASDSDITNSTNRVSENHLPNKLGSHKYNYTSHTMQEKNLNKKSSDTHILDNHNKASSHVFVHSDLVYVLVICSVYAKML